MASIKRDGVVVGVVVDRVVLGSVRTLVLIRLYSWMLVLVGGVGWRCSGGLVLIFRNLVIGGLRGFRPGA